MKNKLKKTLKLGILLFGILLLLWNCENNSEQIESVQEKIDFTIKPQIKTFNLNQLKSDNKFNTLKNSFDVLQNNTLFASRNGTSTSARLVDTLGITIDENSIKQIVYNGYVSYTMLMIEPNDTSDNVSNLVIQEHNGNEHIFTVRYSNMESDTTTASRNSNEPSDNVQMLSGIRSYTDFWEDDEGNSGGGGTDNCEQYETVCNTVNVWIPTSCGCGHSGDDPCSGCYGVYAGWELSTQVECEDICVDYGNNSNPNSGNPNTGGGSTSNDDTPTEVATTLVNTDGSSAVPSSVINALGGEGQLTSDQIIWINNLNNEVQVQALFDFLNDNQNSIEEIEEIIVFLESVAAYPYPHCSSFEYAKPPNINIRACAVINFTETFFAYGELDGEVGTITATANYDLVFFIMPTWMTNGQAATNTAIAVNNAFNLTKNWFYINYDASEEEIMIYLDSMLIGQMALFGGTKTDIPPFAIPSPAPYVTSLFSTGNCN